MNGYWHIDNQHCCWFEGEEQLPDEWQFLARRLHPRPLPHLDYSEDQLNRGYVTIDRAHYDQLQSYRTIAQSYYERNVVAVKNGLAHVKGICRLWSLYHANQNIIQKQNAELRRYEEALQQYRESLGLKEEELRQCKDALKQSQQLVEERKDDLRLCHQIYEAEIDKLETECEAQREQLSSASQPQVAEVHTQTELCTQSLLSESLFPPHQVSTQEIGTQSEGRSLLSESLFSGPTTPVHKRPNWIEKTSGTLSPSPRSEVQDLALSTDTGVLSNAAVMGSSTTCQLSQLTGTSENVCSITCTSSDDTLQGISSLCTQEEVAVGSPDVDGTSPHYLSEPSGYPTLPAPFPSLASQFSSELEDVSALTSRISDLEAQNRRLKEEKDTILTHSEELQDLLDQEEATNKDFGRRIERLQERVTSCFAREEEIDSLLLEHQRLLDKNEVLGKSLASLKREKEKLLALNSEQEHRSDDLAAKLVEATAKKTVLHVQLEEARRDANMSHLKEVKACLQVACLEDKVSILQAELHTSQIANEELSLQMEQDQSQMTASRVYCSTPKPAVCSLYQELQEADKNKTALSPIHGRPPCHLDSEEELWFSPGRTSPKEIAGLTGLPAPLSLSDDEPGPIDLDRDAEASGDLLDHPAEGDVVLASDSIRTTNKIRTSDRYPMFVSTTGPTGLPAPLSETTISESAIEIKDKHADPISLENVKGQTTGLSAPTSNATTTGYFPPYEEGQSAGLPAPSSDQSATETGHESGSYDNLSLEALLHGYCGVPGQVTDSTCMDQLPNHNPDWTSQDESGDSSHSTTGLHAPQKESGYTPASKTTADLLPRDTSSPVPHEDSTRSCSPELGLWHGVDPVPDRPRDKGGGT